MTQEQWTLESDSRVGLQEILLKKILVELRVLNVNQLMKTCRTEKELRKEAECCVDMQLAEYGYGGPEVVDDHN